MRWVRTLIVGLARWVILAVYFCACYTRALIEGVFERLTTPPEVSEQGSANVHTDE